MDYGAMAKPVSMTTELMLQDEAAAKRRRPPLETAS
jgi:hypothetical protein